MTKKTTMKTYKESTAYCYFIVACYLLLTCSNAYAAGTKLEVPFAEQGKAVIDFPHRPLKAMTEIPFAIQLLDAGGQSVEKAALKLDLTMPAMPMPANKPTATWQNDAYRGKVIFTMAGAWDINVTVERLGYKNETIVFKIEMVVM